MAEHRRKAARAGLVLFAAGFSLCLLNRESISQPESLRFSHIAGDIGLSQSSVQCVVQDTTGFLWFGTEDGLNRYDGYRFTVYRHDPIDTFSISDNYIWRLLRSRSGDLWIGTLKGGLNRYEMSTGRFITYRNDPLDSTTLSHDNVPGLFEERNGTLWVGTWGGGLCKLDPAAKGFVRYRHDPGDTNSLSSNFVSSIQEDKDGNLWVGTSHGLIRIDSTRTHFTRYVHNPYDTKSLSDNMIRNLYIDRNDDVWIATPGGLNRYERTNRRFIHYYHNPQLPRSLSSNLVACMLEDSRGDFWVGTNEGGVCRLDRTTDAFVHFKQGVNPPEGAIGNDVLAIYEDRSGTVWFGTAGGISYFDPRADKFRLYAATPDDPKGFRHVRGMCESRKGGVWIGLNDAGVIRVDRWGRCLERHRANENNRHSLSSDKVLSVLEQRDGTLWVGTQGRGLNRLSPRTDRFVRYVNNPEDPRSLSDNTVIALLEDRNGMVWAGTNGGGLEMFDPERNVFVHHKHSNEPGSISGNWIWSLYEDSKRNIWVGTWTTGLDRFDRKTNTFEVFAHNPTDPNSLSNNSILCIGEDNEGMLLIGTHGGGLERFDGATHQFRHYTEKDGLSNNVVVGILPDKHGELWTSTYKGISRFTPATGAVRNFDVSDGLQSNEFNHGAYCRLSDGTMLFGGIRGLNIFYPDSIRDNTFVPPVVLTGFSVFNAPVPLPQPIGRADVITLSYTENFFSFDYVALSYSSSNKNQYMYKLEGLEDEWVKAGTRRVAYYTHIPPGSYVFHVKGSNNDGVWNEKGAQIAVVVTPPFWGRWWFRLIFSVMLVAGLFLFYRRRVKVLEKDRRTQQEFSLRLMESQENERKRIAAELHDSLGQDLLVIRNRALLGLKDANLSQNARDQLDQISSVATQAVNEVREIAYDLRPYQLDRLGLTKAITSITPGLATAVKLTMDVDPIDDAVREDQSIHVYRIVQEGINNILKHAEATEAHVVIRVEATNIRITISDKGKGMSHQASNESNARRGFGIVGINERAKVLNGTMTIDSTPGKGTTLTVTIPRTKKLP